jgi:glycosyltransferase involved in cell wall biosynthesis
MYRVVVGVPVYNGEAHLETCLASLAAQTEPDALFLICDNASTDATGEIAARWLARDDRFRLIRQEATVPAEQNFAAVLQAAPASRYFCWRAADDTSSPDFLARLADALDGDERLMLAAGRLEAVRGEVNQIERILPAPSTHHPVGSAARARAHLGEARAAWFYGLWRREAISRIYAGALADFPWLWAADMRILLEPCLAGAVTGADTAFCQKLKVREVNGARAQPFYALNDPNQQARLRTQFMRLATQELGKTPHSSLQKLILRLPLWRYVETRSFRGWRIWLARLAAHTKQQP